MVRSIWSSAHMPFPVHKTLQLQHFMSMRAMHSANDIQLLGRKGQIRFSLGVLASDSIDLLV